MISSYPTGPGSRWAPFGATLDNGDVLIAGGLCGVFFECSRASSVVYHPKRNRWTIGAPMRFYRPYGFWAAKLADDAGILFAGLGVNVTNEANSTGEIYDPETETWRLVSRRGGMPNDGSVDSFESQLVVRRDGTVQVTGGTGPFEDFLAAINQSWVLDVD